MEKTLASKELAEDVENYEDLELEEISDDDDDDSDEDYEYCDNSCTALDDAESGTYQTVNQAYLIEITEILKASNQVDCSNALALNKEMQRRLLEVRDRLKRLLQQVKSRFESNEKRLKYNFVSRQSGIGMRGAYLKGGTFYFKGNMFFKDLSCRNCPNNPDYEHRKNVEGEMFPMDFELSGRHIWSMMDKMGIVQSIKEQVIDYLQDRSLLEARGARNNANEALLKKISVHSNKLVNLLEEVDENFQIDWMQISVHNLRHRHSPSSCEGIWNVYLHPSLKRSAWTDEENKQLLDAAVAHNYQDWAAIAATVGKRSDYQCFVQYQTTVCYLNPQRWGKWGKKEDQQLIEIIEKTRVNDVIDWAIVGAYFPQKPRRALHQRYMYSLHPRISHERFTPQEDLLLLAAVKEYGTKFSCIPRTLFPNRSVAQLRTHYVHTLASRHKIQSWSVEDDRKLMDFVAQHGCSLWIKCAEFLGNHSRTSCRTRYLTIQRMLKKNPTAKLEDLPRKHASAKNSIITTENWTEKVQELRENPNVKLKPERKKRVTKKKTQLNVKASAKTRKKVESTQDQTKKQTAPKEAEVKDAVKTKKLQKARKMKPIKSEESTKEKQLISQEQPAKKSKATKPTRSAKPTTDVSNKVQKPHKSPNRSYVQLLRPVNLKVYHYFKYSYNFRLGSDPCTEIGNSCYSYSGVRHALNFRIEQAAGHSYVADYTLPTTQMRMISKRFMQRKTTLNSSQTVGYLLPPALPTAMAFRALCIQAAGQQVSTKEETTTTTTTHEDEHFKNHEAVRLFRVRLCSLFYRSALLSRLNPERFPALSEHLTRAVTLVKDVQQAAVEEIAQSDLSHDYNALEQAADADELAAREATYSPLMLHEVKEELNEEFENERIRNVALNQLAECDAAARKRKIGDSCESGLPAKKLNAFDDTSASDKTALEAGNIKLEEFF